MLAPDVETRPWAEQLAADDTPYRAQLAYLYERSAFYRAKLAAAGFASDRTAGGEFMTATETALGEAYSEPAANVRDFVASVKSQQA